MRDAYYKHIAKSQERQHEFAAGMPNDSLRETWRVRIYLLTTDDTKMFASHASETYSQGYYTEDKNA